ncbi:MAG: heme-binding protein [Thioalkalispiraceae bacterium]|jgi:uncharacterized protein GlcG (DUF336 family)
MLNKFIFVYTVLVIQLALSSTATAAENKAYLSTRVLSTVMAIKAATVAEQTCNKMGYQVSVAVVDRYGTLISFARNPLSGAHTITISQDKAYTAATFQGDTIELTKRLEFLKGTPRLSLVGGGVPVKIAGYMYGAIGVSGAPAKKTPGDVDHECAMAGVNAVREAIEFGE